jgi:hypothetical protein
VVARASFPPRGIGGVTRLTAVTRLDDMRLLDSESDEVRLGELWSDRPVALVFLRHYG